MPHTRHASSRSAHWLLSLAAGMSVLTSPLSLASAQAATQAEVEATAAIATRVADAVCDRRVVVLGELPSHGEGRGFELKAKIVAALLTRCGFGALLFEAPIYDFLGLERASAEGSADPLQLDRAIGGFWWTRELADWRRWLFARARDHAVLLGGLDDQPSATSHHARAVLPTLVAQRVSAPRATECREAVTRYLFWRYDDMHRHDAPEQERLERCAEEAAVSPSTTSPREVGRPERVMLENLTSHFARERGSPAANDRDTVMDRNFRWYRSRLPADGKVIVWTATVHAARQQGELARKPLGAWLADTWGDRLTVIAVTAFTGESSMAGRPAKALPAAPAGSLEALATDADTPMRYLDRAALQRIGSVPSRLLGRFVSADWSMHFDGVVVVRDEVAPTFEERR